jgi:hypothetical protein
MKETFNTCDLCRVVDTTCRETIPLIQGRFYKKGNTEILLFEKIKDCPVKKTYESILRIQHPIQNETSEPPKGS